MKVADYFGRNAVARSLYYKFFSTLKKKNESGKKDEHDYVYSYIKFI